MRLKLIALAATIIILVVNVAVTKLICDGDYRGQTAIWFVYCGFLVHRAFENENEKMLLRHRIQQLEKEKAND